MNEILLHLYTRRIVKGIFLSSSTDTKSCDTNGWKSLSILSRSDIVGSDSVCIKLTGEDPLAILNCSFFQRVGQVALKCPCS